MKDENKLSDFTKAVSKTFKDELDRQVKKIQKKQPALTFGKLLLGMLISKKQPHKTFNKHVIFQEATP